MWRERDFQATSKMSKANEFSWVAAQADNARETQTFRSLFSEGFTVQELVVCLQRLMAEKPEMRTAPVLLAEYMRIIGVAREVEADIDEATGEKKVIIS